MVSKRSGGILLYVKDSLCAELLIEELNVCEGLWVRLWDKFKWEIFV